MDLSNITSMYSDIYANAANQSAGKLQEKLSGADYSKADEKELMDACKQFESYFVEQMYKSMLKTIPESDTASGTGTNMMEFYKDKMVEGIAQQTTEQNGGLGLAKMLYEQMRRNYGLEDKPE